MLHERLKKLLEKLEISTSEFSRSLGYESPTKVYNWIEGRFRPHPEFFDRVENAYPEVNQMWLRRGVGSMTDNEGMTAEMLLNKKDTEILALATTVARLENELFQIKRREVAFLIAIERLGKQA